MRISPNEPIVTSSRLPHVRPSLIPKQRNNKDAYWLEYGHHWVMRYAAASDVRHVLLGLLALVSFFVYGVQHTRYTTAVQYLRKAAEKNLGPKQGGTAAVRKGGLWSRSHGRSG